MIKLIFGWLIIMAQKYKPLIWARDIIKEWNNPILNPEGLEAASVMIGRYVGADQLSRSNGINSLMENVKVYCEDGSQRERFKWMIERAIDEGIKNPATEEMVEAVKYKPRTKLPKASAMPWNQM